MNRNEIAHIIIEIRKDAERHIIGAFDSITLIVKKIMNSPDEDKRQVIDFLFSEIETNEYNLSFVGLDIVEELQLKEAGDVIYKSYNSIVNGRDSVQWKQACIRVLLLLQYQAPLKFYLNHIDDIKNDENGRTLYFRTSILLCKLYPEKGLEILSDFYVEWLAGDKLTLDSRDFFSRILFAFFFKFQKDYTTELVFRTQNKNKKAGENLKIALVTFLKSEMMFEYKREFVDEKIKAIEAI